MKLRICSPEKFISIPIVILFICITNIHAQIPPPDPLNIYQLDYLNTYADSYPFSASRSLVVDETIPGYPLCFMGSGGGVFILDISNTQPSLFISATGLGNKLKTNGFIWDLAKRNETGLIRLFGAAGRDGVYVWTLTTTSPYTSAEIAHFPLPPNNIARAIEYFEYQGEIYLLVGTWNQGVNNITSKLYLMDYPGGTILHSQTVNGIWRLDATTSLGTDPIVFTADGVGGVKSYRVDVSNYPNLFLVFEDEFPVPPAEPIVARDVLFDEIGYQKQGRKILFAACYRDGMYVFDVSQSGSNRLDKKNVSWQNLGDRGLAGLGSYEQGNNIYLGIAAGSGYEAELQNWGGDDRPFIGKEYPSPLPNDPQALLLYDVTNVPTIDPLYRAIYEEDPTIPKSNFRQYDVVFGLGFDPLRVYTSCDAHGLQVFKIINSPPTDIISAGSFDQENKVPLGSVDSVLTQGNNIYTVSETALQTYNMGTSEGPLHHLIDYDYPAGVYLTAMPNALYTSRQSDVQFYSLQNPDDPVLDGKIWEGNDVKRQGCYPIDVVIGSVTKRHLYICYTRGFPEAWINEGALGIWDVTDHSNPRRLGHYYSQDPTGNGTGVYVDTLVKEYNNHRYAYVSFHESKETGVGTGLYCFEVTTLANSTERISLKKTIPITTEDRQGAGAHLLFSQDGSRLYGAFGRGGIAVFDISNPADPQLIGSPRLLYGSALQVRPVQSGGSIYGIVSLLSGYLGILDVTNAQTIQNSDILYYRTPFQANVTCIDPLMLDNPPYMLLADGRGGVRRVVACAFWMP